MAPGKSDRSTPHPQELMRAALEAARAGIERGQSPFGCAIAWKGRLVAASHNTVAATTDVTAHAEVNALRDACRSTGQILLEGAVVATTCEPCPMCISALHWARVAEVHYGASIADATQAGFNELAIPAREVVQQGGSPVALYDQLLAEECRQLFQQWLQRSDRVVY